MAIDYFWDGQLRRYKEQFGRIFNTIKYTSKIDSNGSPILSNVPCIPATADLQAMNIMVNNSELTLPSIPMFAYYIIDIQQAPDRRQNPHYVRDLGVTYRDIDPTTGLYTSKVGNEYHVQNYMPVPYNLTFRLDLWFTNDNNREEIAEQIMTYFNPMIDIQTNRNALDWSSLTVLEMTSMNWNPMTYGTSTAQTTRTMYWTFNVPIWINPPSKVKKSNKIQEIIVSIGDGDKDDMNNMSSDDPLGKYFNNDTLLSRTVVTPGNFSIMIKRNYSESNLYTVTLIVDPNNKTDENNIPWDWNVLIQRYGKIEDNKSLMHLLSDIENLDYDNNYNPGANSDRDHEKIISGTIRIDSNPNILYYKIDPGTVPQAYNSSYFIDSVIDPSKRGPFDGYTSKPENLTYLILNTIPQGSLLWGDIYEDGKVIDSLDGAVQNDILQYDGTRWNKIFNSVTNKDKVNYGISNCNGDYFTFDKGWWRLTIDGEYNPGYWRLTL